MVRICLLFHRLASLLLVILVVLLVADTIGRLLGRPVTGSYEFTQYGFALIVSFSIAFAGLRGGHLVIDIVSNRLPKTLAEVLGKVSGVLALFTFSLVSFRLFVDGIEAYRLKERSSTLGLPTFLFTILLGLGFAVLVAVLFSRLLSRQEAQE